MSVKTTSWLCSRPSVYLMFVFLLTSYLSACAGILTKRVKSSGDESITRPVTTTPQGTIQGINMLTRHNRTIFGFLGVPYARPPVGDLRFRAPLPPEPWNGTFDASRDVEPCCQPGPPGGVKGQEDCLYHNVFTPQLPTSENISSLPVMVYIIGGGFRFVHNSVLRYNPELLLDHGNVILIVPNFRVGALGYLSTGDEVSPGNYGLKDIVRVLEWVQENIVYYGGDPNRVTLCGGSSGAMSVHILALSKLTDGLIHNYITQSGSAASNVVNKPREWSVNRTIQLAEYFNCPIETSSLLINCLRNLDVSQIVDSDSLFHIWNRWPKSVWYPTPEPDIEGALITDMPENLIADGKIRDLPWLASITLNEGLHNPMLVWYSNPDLFEDFLNNIDLVLPVILGYYYRPEIPQNYTDVLKSYYFNDLTANRSLLLTNLTQLLGDALFVYPTYKGFQRHLALAKNPQYLALFGYRGTFSHTYNAGRGSAEYSHLTGHGDELIYLFENRENRFGPPDYKRTENDWVMVDNMVQLWTSFATNSTPTMLESFNNVIWEPYSSKNNYLRIGNGSDVVFEMDYDLYMDRMRFWEDLSAAHGQNW